MNALQTFAIFKRVVTTAVILLPFIEAVSLFTKEPTLTVFQIFVGYSLIYIGLLVEDLAREINSRLKMLGAHLDDDVEHQVDDDHWPAQGG